MGSNTAAIREALTITIPRLQAENKRLKKALQDILDLKYESGRSRSYIEKILETASGALAKSQKPALNHENVWAFRSQHKIPLNDFRLLMEAFRRREFLNASDEFLGLGTPSQYKSKYFEPSFCEQQRIKNWYKLTKIGETMLAYIYKHFQIPTRESLDNVDQRNAINSFLFEL